MLFSHNFTIERFSKMIEENIEHRGNKAISEDAELIYYYLDQKYSHSEMKRFIKYFNNILNSPIKEKLQKLILFANKK